jgi:acetolactate synthase-1/2/3 large subunit
MKLADYVIQTLSRNGIDTVMLVYGSAIGDLVDAFTRTEGIRHVCPIHEQGGGFMAEGWAKVTGKTGCAMATSGPGMMNLVTPCGNAFYDSVPILYLTGNVKTKFMRPDPSIRQIGFQESDPIAIFSSITKHSAQILDPADIRHELEKCLFLCQDGRKGPCLLDLPIDIQQAEIDPDQLESFDAREYWQQDAIADHLATDEFVARYLVDLEKAQRPVMLIGGGCRNSIGSWRAVACKLQMPCYPTYNAIDIVTSDFAWYGGRIGTYGGAGRNLGIQNSDLLLAVGSRISGRITGGAPETFAPGAKKYLVEIDDGLLQKQFQQVPFEEMLKADAGLFFRRLQAGIGFSNSFPHYATWTMKCLSWRDKYDPVAPHVAKPFEPLDPYLFMRELSRQAPDNAIIVSDCGGNWIITAHAFETKQGQRLFTNNGNSPMGFSFCGALGAWFADPSRPVICVIGDGGMQMNIQELQTMKHYGCNVKVFIVNNGIYGITKQYQGVNFQGREIACGPDGYSVPWFYKVADAYVLNWDVLSQNGGMDSAIKSILEDGKPEIVDVRCLDFHDYSPKVTGWSTPIHKMSPMVEE